jgi:hypothetical protein
MTDETDRTRNRELLAAYTAWAEAFTAVLPGQTTLSIRQYPIAPSWHNRHPQMPTAYTLANISSSSGFTLALRWDSTNVIGFMQIESNFPVEGEDRLYRGETIKLPTGMDPVAAAEIVETTVLASNRGTAAFFARLHAEQASFADKRRTELAPLIKTGVVAADDNTLRLGWDTVLRSPGKDVKVTVSGSEDSVTVRLRYLTQQQAAAVLTAYRAATAPRAPEQIAA